MTRKLALLLVCLGVCSRVFALGLGEIEVQSALNQRFEATIELLNADGLEDGEIIPNLASSQDFERVGVERFFYLLDLEFTADFSDPNRPVVRITSTRPVREPFVNFLVEVLWPSGRLLREYTVLLDPPEYTAQPAIAPAAVSRSPAPTREATPRPPSPPPAASRGAARPGTTTSAAGGRGRYQGETYGATDRFDTLWDIALQVRPGDDVTVQQTMLALQRLNPEAFINGNINLLKAGYVLRVPDAAEARRVSSDEAIARVAQENDRWRQGLTGAPLDARDPAPTPRQAPEQGGELRLVSGEESVSATGAGTAAGGTGGPAGTGQSAEELAAAEEELDRVRLENADLETRLQQRQAAEQELQRQLELRNQELARIQQQLAAQQASAPAPAPRSQGLLFGLSSTMLGLIAGAVLLVLALIVMLLRRRGAESDAFARSPGGIEADFERTQQVAAGVIGGAAAGEALDFEDDAAAGDEAAAEGDVIAEADIYMAYGRFSEAARVLSAALESEPERTDLRLKLMEVHVETGDVEAFNDEARTLQTTADADTLEQADQLAGRLAGALLSSGVLSDGSGAGPAREGAADASLDFDLAEGGADLDSLDIDLDLDDDDEASLTPTADEPEFATEDDGFELDLELEESDEGDDEFALELEGDTPTPPAAAMDEDEDEFALDIETPEGAAAALAETSELETPSTSDAGEALSFGGELDLDADQDEITTKLELARAYVDMGDADGAREILDEVVRDGDESQKQEAGELLSRLS
ncbi:MAG: FimV/HubP family polar landmark protein [Pseudomonadales bacterium]|nr:FimV/HubP family polar landmark protein [Pseudomonadales bacterium]